MRKKLVSIGNSYGLVIDKSILELLHIAPDSELELSTDGTRLVIEPVREKGGVRKVKVPVAFEPPKPRALKPRYGFPKKQPW